MRPTIDRPRQTIGRAFGVCIAAVLSACGGGGGSSPVTPPPVAGSLHDTTNYSVEPGASLTSAVEAAAKTSQTIAIGSRTIAYTANAGHLTASDPAQGGAEASLFYVAYTADGQEPATRPLVFFYNGGPGSASVWLHLGSFAPRRIVTNVPSTTLPLPFQLTDNADSLIDTADLVFVDAVGTGYSEAISPHTNQSFWGVDADAAVMRDFIARYVAVNQRGASPTFLYGESYGTTRTAVLANQMVTAGMRLDGIVLQSSVLDYNSNCDVTESSRISCAGYLPSYGSIGAWFQLTQPAAPAAATYAAQLRSYAAATYAPAVADYLSAGTLPSAGLVTTLVDLTGAPQALWNADLNLGPTTYRSQVLPGELMGRYDARVIAANGSALAADGDPSSTLINAPFTAAIASRLANELLYTTTTSYAMSSNAIATWNFGHDGNALPDTIPDLAAALLQKPTLRVLSIGGYQDLATPYYQTELDLARLTAPPVTEALYSSGHMTYLDNAARPLMKAQIAAFIAGAAP
ncbi:MAG: peptidase S10 [Proteobacteria bacterium]|nr:peptidase S10 [Pseudomonadota bacterium]